MRSKLSMKGVEEILWDFYLEKGSAISKSDFSSLPIPSYNTCLRNGMNLKELNLEFSRKNFKIYKPLCKNCNSELQFEKKENSFCSRSCSATFNNSLRPSSDKVNCQFCGKSCSDKFCSRQCAASSRHQSGFFNWLFSPWPIENVKNTTLRKYLITLNSNKCSCCGISDWCGRAIVLEVDHLNGDSTDNSPENLRLLCPNCHSQTITYKGRNRGFGRHNRKLRYRSGKSY